MINKEIYFIDDPDFDDRIYFLEKFDSVIDPKGYRRKLFFRAFVVNLIKACKKEKKEKKELKPKLIVKKEEPIRKIKEAVVGGEETKKISFPSKKEITRMIELPALEPVKVVKTWPQIMPVEISIVPETPSSEQFVKPEIQKPVRQLEPRIPLRMPKKIKKIKRLPYLKPKNRRIYLKGGKRFYVPGRESNDYLEQLRYILEDPNVKRVYCEFGRPLLVDYLDYKKMPTTVKFDNVRKLNKMLKKLAKENGFRFDKNRPILLRKLKDGSLFQGNLGGEFLKPSFIIVKNKKFYKGGGIKGLV
jgi:hypothetical protein